MSALWKDLHDEISVDDDLSLDDLSVDDLSLQVMIYLQMTIYLQMRIYMQMIIYLDMMIYLQVCSVRGVKPFQRRIARRLHPPMSRKLTFGKSSKGCVLYFVLCGTAVGSHPHRYHPVYGHSIDETRCIDRPGTMKNLLELVLYHLEYSSKR